VLSLSGGGTAIAAQQAAAAAKPTLISIKIPDRHGKIPAKWINHPGEPMADVLLPAGYDPAKRYPLLFLLHGLGGSYQFYVQQGLLPELDHLDAIVVMPDGGPAGWYADWWNDGQRGGPAWETYELDDVLPTVLRRFPIRPGRRWHAIAGISMGGLGAGYLGGRLPGFFGTVASLSGFVDPQLAGPVLQPLMAGVTNGFVAGPISRRDHNPVPIYGPPTEFYADGHNPSRLVMNLKQSRVFVSTGTGVPNASSLGVILAGFAEEIVNGTWEEGGLIYPMSRRYAAALSAAGVNVTYQPHSGGHDLPAFHKEIQQLLRWGLFKPVPTRPRSWVNDTVATSGRLWDIEYRFDSPPEAVVRFTRNASELSISDDGRESYVTITTSGGCVSHIRTPATIHLPSRRCGAAGLPTTRPQVSEAGSRSRPSPASAGQAWGSTTSGSGWR
jgi:S-formylglutathione hydrolase FrmB